MKFADFYVGQIIQAGPVAVSEAEVIGFASAYDPNGFTLMLMPRNTVALVA